jgi:phage-related protein
MANQVTLTFAGETKQLEESFGKAGGAARKMGDDTEHAAAGFHKAGEAADAVDTKAMGFRDTITGVQDSMTGLKNIASGKGSLADGLLTLGMGVGDLASGFYNFLIPALASSKAGTLAQAAAGKVAAGASKVWAAGQWLLNTALLASPITWIVVGIIALVAVIVLIATKTNWFQRAWGAAWGAIRSAASSAWGFIRQIPGWISGAFSNVAGAISGPFRSAFNFIASAWNNTVGAISFSVPSWVPGIGGNGFSVPHIPYFHSGGVVPGVVGTNVLAMVQAGERVGSVASRGGGDRIVVNVAGRQVADALLDDLRGAVRTRGGNVQAVLGRG